MDIRNLLTANRSYRRFRGDEPIHPRTLVELIELTRLCPSAVNRQPLRFLIVCDPEANTKLFGHLTWARALADTGSAQAALAYMQDTVDYLLVWEAGHTAALADPRFGAANAAFADVRVLLEPPRWSDGLRYTLYDLQPPAGS